MDGSGTEDVGLVLKGKREKEHEVSTGIGLSLLP